MHELLSLLLRHAAIEPRIVKAALLEQLLNEAEHRGPFRKQHHFAVGLGEYLLEQFVEARELRRMAGRLFVDQ